MMVVVVMVDQRSPFSLNNRKCSSSMIVIGLALWRSLKLPLQCRTWVSTLLSNG